jgi:hypothetical protein
MQGFARATSRLVLSIAIGGCIHSSAFAQSYKAFGFENKSQYEGWKIQQQNINRMQEREVERRQQEKDSRRKLECELRCTIGQPCSCF